MARRDTRLIIKNNQVPNAPFSGASVLVGEAIVNTADGIMMFSGSTLSTSEWTPAGTGGNSTFFEVGSNLYDLNLRNRITKYEGQTGSNLVGKFLSGTTNGFVLANITDISDSVDSYVSGATWNPNILTLSLKNNKPNVSVTIDSFSGLTVDGLTITGTGLYNTTISGTNPNEIVNVNFLTGYTLTNDVYVTGSTLTVADNDTNTQQSILSYNGTPNGGPYFIDTQNTFTTGGTYNSGTTSLDFKRNDGVTYSVNLSTLDINDTKVTGFTYNPSSNTFTISDSDNNSYSSSINVVSGLTINGNLNVTGNTSLQSLTGTSALFSGSGSNVLTVVGSGGTLFSVSGSNGEIFTVHDNNTGPIFNVNSINNTPIFEIYSGGSSLFYGTVTVTGNTTLYSGLTANTLNLSSTPVINNSNTQFLTRNVSNGNVEVTSLSAITSLDTFVTGFTYSSGSNTFTIKQNQGQSNLTATFDTVSGLTVSNDLTVVGNLTVFGQAISAFTNELYVEDSNITLNYNPTGSTTITSVNAGLTIQDGNGISSGDVKLDIVRMENLTGLTSTQVPDVSEYTSSTGFVNRGWITQLNDIVIRSTDTTDNGTTGSINGVRVLTEWDILDGGQY
jgi:hypothetical protein